MFSTHFFHGITFWLIKNSQNLALNQNIFSYYFITVKLADKLAGDFLCVISTANSNKKVTALISLFLHGVSNSCCPCYFIKQNKKQKQKQSKTNPQKQYESTRLQKVNDTSPKGLCLSFGNWSQQPKLQATVNYQQPQSTRTQGAQPPP